MDTPVTDDTHFLVDKLTNNMKSKKYSSTETS